MTTVEIMTEAQEQKLDGVAIGVLLGFDPAGVPLVATPFGPEGTQPARQTVSLSREDIGAQVAVLFEAGDPLKPLIVGRLLTPAAEPQAAPPPTLPVAAAVDDETLRFEAQRQIELRCGEASITLTRAGKIILRGTYVLTRSTGANKIKGASVQIN